MTRIEVKTLSQDIARFLEFKRALGYPYHRGAYTLCSFNRFVQQHTETNSTFAFDTMLNAWLTRIADRKPVTITLELGVIRQFCLYRRRYDPRGFVPGREWAPQPAESIFLPHIFSPDELQLILNGIDHHHGKNTSPAMLRVLILILYCTGLRPGEAVRLRLQEVDLEQAVFMVNESKGKSRIVPFHADLEREINAYLRERKRIANDGIDTLLVRLSGDPLPAMVASNVVRRLLRQVGLKPACGRVGPRPYDFRHTFAVHRLTEWYHQGTDIHAQLPWLSAYMGHDNVLGTEVYLTATPELMALASQRFEMRVKHARKVR